MASGFAGLGGKFGGATISDFGGAASDLFSGQATGSSLKLKAAGDRAEASNYDLAATLAGQNEQFTEQSTAVKLAQQQRQVYQGIGTETADVAGAGFTSGGSSLDLLRSSAEQGALTHAVMGQQGLITEAAYTEQQQSYTTMAAAARYAADTEDKEASSAERNSFITGGIKIAAGVATLA